MKKPIILRQGEHFDKMQIRIRNDIKYQTVVLYLTGEQQKKYFIKSLAVGNGGIFHLYKIVNEDDAFSFCSFRYGTITHNNDHYIEINCRMGNFNVFKTASELRCEMRQDKIKKLL